MESRPADTEINLVLGLPERWYRIVRFQKHISNLNLLIPNHTVNIKYLENLKTLTLHTGNQKLDSLEKLIPKALYNLTLRFTPLPKRCILKDLCPLLKKLDISQRGLELDWKSFARNLPKKLQSLDCRMVKDFYGDYSKLKHLATMNLQLSSIKSWDEVKFPKCL
eukprot:UN29706